MVEIDNNKLNKAINRFVDECLTKLDPITAKEASVLASIKAGDRPVVSL